MKTSKRISLKTNPYRKIKSKFRKQNIVHNILITTWAYIVRNYLFDEKFFDRHQPKKDEYICLTTERLCLYKTSKGCVSLYCIYYTYICISCLVSVFIKSKVELSFMEAFYMCLFLY